MKFRVRAARHSGDAAVVFFFMLKRWAFASATALSRLCFGVARAALWLGDFFTDVGEWLWSSRSLDEIREQRKGGI